MLNYKQLLNEVFVISLMSIYTFSDLGNLSNLGPVARSLVSANRWLRGIKMYRFPWYLTLVSTNHASSNPGMIGLLSRAIQEYPPPSEGIMCELGVFPIFFLENDVLKVDRILGLTFFKARKDFKDSKRRFSIYCSCVLCSMDCLQLPFIRVEGAVL